MNAEYVMVIMTILIVLEYALEMLLLMSGVCQGDGSACNSPIATTLNYNMIEDESSILF